MVSPEVAVPAVGEIVDVAWGFDTIPAEILAVYDTPRGPRFTLSVPVLGPRGETLDVSTVTLPIDALR